MSQPNEPSREIIPTVIAPKRVSMPPEQPRRIPPTPPMPVTPSTPAARRCSCRDWWKAIGVVLLITLLILATRWPVITAARGGRLMNMDELYMVDASMARFVGAPGNLLQWPGGPIRSFVVAWLPIDFALHNGIKPNHETPGKLVNYVGQQIQSPWRTIEAAQWFVAIVSALGFAALYPPLAARSGSRAMAAACVLLLATCPLVWMRTSMSLGDGLSWGFLAFACAAACSVMLSDGAAAIWVGLFIGAALASKVTSLIAAPLPFFLLMQFHRSYLKSIVLVALFTVMGYVVACPEVAVLPITTLRGIVGNVAGRDEDYGGAHTAGPLNSLRAIGAGVPIWLLVVLPFALVGLFIAKRWWAAVGLLSCLGIAFVVTYKPKFIEAHYLTPLCVASIVTVALGFSSSGLGGTIWKSLGKPVWLPWVAVVLVVAFAGLNAWGFVSKRNSALQRYSGVFEAANYLHAHYHTERLAIDTYLMPYSMPDLNGRSVRENLALARRAVNDTTALRTWIAGHGLDPRVVDLASAWFNQAEQMSLANWSAVAAAVPEDRPGISAWVTESSETAAQRNQSLTFADAVRKFHAGEFDAILLQQPIPGEKADKVFPENAAVPASTQPNSDPGRPEDAPVYLFLYVKH